MDECTRKTNQFKKKKNVQEKNWWRQYCHMNCKVVVQLLVGWYYSSTIKTNSWFGRTNSKTIKSCMGQFFSFCSRCAQYPLQLAHPFNSRIFFFFLLNLLIYRQSKSKSKMRNNDHTNKKEELNLYFFKLLHNSIF